MNLFPNPAVNNLTQPEYDRLNAEWQVLVENEGLEINTEWYYQAAEYFSDKIAGVVRHVTLSSPN